MGWFFESPVYLECFLSVLRSVELLNRLLGLFELLVLEQCIALHIARPSVNIQHAILYLAMFAEFVLKVFLLEFFGQASHNEHVAFHALQDGARGPI